MNDLDHAAVAIDHKVDNLVPKVEAVNDLESLIVGLPYDFIAFVHWRVLLSVQGDISLSLSEYIIAQSPAFVNTFFQKK
jgi:hypothetical protein